MLKSKNFFTFKTVIGKIDANYIFENSQGLLNIIGLIEQSIKKCHSINRRSVAKTIESILNLPIKRIFWIQSIAMNIFWLN